MISKKGKFKKILGKTVPWVVTLFFILAIMFLWEFLKANKTTLILITGGFILLYIAFGIWKWKKFWRGVKKRF